ncbi:DNA repair REV1 [Babesia ovis]|uniref:DNA repair REV1 n=1 Tax=Babesia ovis TaxID=5869 RepID=A0A9W5T878_BABOV|nr:DNA repair REV1 [Babesia ovis]
MSDPVKFGGGGLFSDYMERRRRGVAAHYEQKYGSDDVGKPVKRRVNCGLQRPNRANRTIDIENTICTATRNGNLESTEEHIDKLPLDESSPFCKNLTEDVYIMDNADCPKEQLFHGCYFYIDGVVNPYQPLLDREPCENAALHANETLVKYIVLYGGHIEISLSEYVTHYVVENVALGCTKWWSMRQKGGRCAKYAVITPAYIFECHLQSRRLPEAMFLPSSLKMKPRFMSLTQTWKNTENCRLYGTINDGVTNSVKSDSVVTSAKVVDPTSVKIDQCGNLNVVDTTSLKMDQCDNVNMVDQCDTAIVDDPNSLKIDQCDPTGVSDHCDNATVADTKLGSDEYNASLVHSDSMVDSTVNNIVDNEYGLYIQEKKSTIQCEDDIHQDTDQVPPSLPDENKETNNTGDIANMVNEYYKRSRLHLLGMWKTRVEKEFDFEPFSPLQQGMLQGGKILHIDMDAFFVSVAIRGKPHLKNTPLCISHGTGRNSASEIATCNYEARAYGIHKGMWVRDAIRLCPSLKFVRYDFDAINETAMKILKIVSGLTNRVYSASCDELYIECSMGYDSCDISTYMSFALNLAHTIETETGCPLSVGIGDNMMLSKLASQRCKALKHRHEEVAPGCVHSANVYAVMDVEAFIASVSLHELPGVGDRTLDILRTCGYVYCRDVHDKNELKELVGEKLGNTIYQFSRGRDFRNINTAEKRSHIVKNKTITSAINYGIRISTMDQVHEYMRELIKQVWERVEVALGHILDEGSGKNSCAIPQAQIMLKIRVRSPEASVEPAKYMGCGLCDEYTSSVSGDLLSQKSVFGSLVTCWQNIVSKHQFPLEDLRGISLGIYRIKSTGDTERNTLDKFLVTVTPSPLPSDVYPVSWDAEAVHTPAKTGHMNLGSKSRNRYQESILPFMSSSPMRLSTPVRRKSRKRSKSKQLTLYDVLSSPRRASGSNGYSSVASSDDVPDASGIHSDTRFADCLNPKEPFESIQIQSSTTNAWLFEACNEVVEKRLQEICRTWSFYKDMVSFYREVFSHYATLLFGATHPGTDSLGRYRNNPYDDWPVAIATIEYVVPEVPGLHLEDLHMEPRDAYEFDPSEHVVPPELTNLHSECVNTPCLPDTSSIGNNSTLTLFDMRCICKDCRLRILGSFDISMLHNMDCTSASCFLRRIKDIEPVKAGIDCTTYAVTMVVCCLVYVSLLRTVIHLTKKARFDLLQTFVHYCITDAASFKAPLLGPLDRCLQTRFFNEAKNYLIKVYNLYERPRL